MQWKGRATLNRDLLTRQRKIAILLHFWRSMVGGVPSVWEMNVKENKWKKSKILPCQQCWMIYVSYQNTVSSQINYRFHKDVVKKPTENTGRVKGGRTSKTKYIETWSSTLQSQMTKAQNESEWKLWVRVKIGSLCCFELKCPDNTPQHAAAWGDITHVQSRE